MTTMPSRNQSATSNILYYFYFLKPCLSPTLLLQLNLEMHSRGILCSSFPFFSKQLSRPSRLKHFYFILFFLVFWDRVSLCWTLSWNSVIVSILIYPVCQEKKKNLCCFVLHLWVEPLKWAHNAAWQLYIRPRQFTSVDHFISSYLPSNASSSPLGWYTGFFQWRRMRKVTSTLTMDAAYIWG